MHTLPPEDDGCPQMVIVWLFAMFYGFGLGLLAGWVVWSGSC